MVRLVSAIEELAPGMGGVFSASDLANIIGGGSDLANARMRGRLVREGMLTRIQKGMYVTASCDLWVAAARVSGQSYVSMDSVLARNGLTGTVPVRSVSAIHPGRKRVIETVAGTIYLHALSEELFFGIDRRSDGVRVADSEKAFIDLLYYHTKGVRFAIDPRRDVALHKLDGSRIARYLKRYRNPKFVAFVKGVLGER